MKRYARDKSEPMLKPVQHIELSDKNIKLRLILMCAALIIAAVAVGFGVHSCLSAEKGWQKIDATTRANNLSAEFSLTYELGKTDVSPTLEKKSLSSAYTAALMEAYKLFDPYAAEGYLRMINSQPGESVKIDSELYGALEKMLGYGRLLYLEPLNEMYDQVFGADGDVYAAAADPAKDPETGERARKTAEFIKSDDNVRLELLGSDTVRLTVSNEYKAFASENEMTGFIGFGWLKNAFAADHISSRLNAAGYRNGYLTSVDGYSAYLNGDVSGYGVSLYVLKDEGFVAACGLADVPIIYGVNLRRFPISRGFSGYVYADGSAVMPYIDENGAQKTASDVLFMYSEKKSCADIALEAYGIYISDFIDEGKLLSAEEKGICAVCIDKDQIVYTGPAPQLIDTAGGYRLKKAQ